MPCAAAASQAPSGASGWRTIAQVSQPRVRFVVATVHKDSSVRKLTTELVVLAHGGRHFGIGFVSIDGTLVIVPSALGRGIEEDRGTIAREAGHVAVDEQAPVVAEERLDNLMTSARSRAPDHSGVDIVMIVPAPENDGRSGGGETADQGVGGSVERGVGLNRD